MYVSKNGVTDLYDSSETVNIVRFDSPEETHSITAKPSETDLIRPIKIRPNTVISVSWEDEKIPHYVHITDEETDFLVAESCFEPYTLYIKSGNDRGYVLSDQDYDKVLRLFREYKNGIGIPTPVYNYPLRSLNLMDIQKKSVTGFESPIIDSWIISQFNPEEIDPEVTSYYL